MRLRLAAAALLLAALVAASAAPATRAAEGDPPATPDALPFKKGDRVVFLGDSITEQRRWTRYVAQFVACRAPELDVRFFNAGWGGDTAKGGRARLLRDVFGLKPNVVAVFFGMNDGGYRAPDPKVTETYTANLAGIVKDLQGIGARVIVMSPGSVDAVAKPELTASGYDRTLEGLADAAAGVAKAAKCTYVDMHRPMRDFLAARRAAGLTNSLVPDGIHPNDEGHLFMTAALLRALGVQAAPSLGSFDSASGRGDGFEVVEKSKDELLLRATRRVTVPFWCAPGTERTAAESGLAEIAWPRLRVTGLAAGDWEVSLDEGAPAVLSSADLAQGAPVPPGASAKGKAVHDLVQRREDNYYHLWRNIQIPMDGVPGADEAVRGLLALDAGLQTRTYEAAAPAAGMQIRISRAPAGTNLALSKKYECSDANSYGWGAGGLTDGSWQADAKHCFATGATESTGKTVTVDLEKSQRLGCVRFGVPAFGSTRTVTVSVSQEGRSFTTVGKTEFAQKTAARRTITFDPRAARYVRLTFEDRWPETVEFPPPFAFVTELEVYGAK